MSMPSFWIVVLAIGCGGTAETPTSAPPVPPAKPASDILDEGTFNSVDGTTVLAKETFTIRRSGDHRIVRSRSAALEDPDNHFVDGELEVDAAWRPVRGAYRKVTPADGFEYRIGGTPLTLDITRDDERHPEHIVATRPIDVYATGPGLAALTALCSVDRDVILSTFGSRKTAWTRHVEAYRGAPVGKLQRIVIDVEDSDFEIVCDGERLVAGLMPRFHDAFVRAGREADLAALRAAPRPAAKAWKHPVDESEPWNALLTSFVDGKTLVTHDKRHRMTRLTAFDVTTHEQLAHRDFRVPAGSVVVCRPMPPNRFICMNDRSGYFHIIDARTLADKTDLAPLFRTAAPDSSLDRWHAVVVKGERVTLPIDDARAVTIDVAAGTSTVGPISKDPSARDATECDSASRGPEKVGTESWSIDQNYEKATLLRTAGKKALAPIELPFYYPDFMKCRPKGGGVYLISYGMEKSSFGLLRPDATVAWKVELGVHPQTLRVLGGTLLLTSSEQSRRILAIDAATGAVLWETPGIQAVP